MVTASGMRAVGVSAAALGGMLIGFYVQDRIKMSRIARMDARVEAEVQRRKALLFAGAPDDELVAAGSGAPPSGAAQGGASAAQLG